MNPINRFFICVVIFCVCKQTFAQSYLKLIDTQKSKEITILPGAVLAFTSSQRIEKIRLRKIRKNKQPEYIYQGTFRYMEDSNMVFTLYDAGSATGTPLIISPKGDTTLYKFNINEIKRVRIMYAGFETFWAMWVFIYSIALIRPAAVLIDNTHASDGYKFLMAAGAGVAIGVMDVIIVTDLLFPQKPRKIIGKRYKFEIHKIEQTKIYNEH